MEGGLYWELKKDERHKIILQIGAAAGLGGEQITIREHMENVPEHLIWSSLKSLQ